MCKIVSSESGEKYAQIKHAKTVQNCSKHMWVDFDVRGLQGMDFFSEGIIIMHYFSEFKMKMV